MAALEVFKSKAINPQQTMFVLFGKVDGWEGKIGVFSKPTSKQISEKHKLALFRQRYGQFPRIGMMVDVEPDKKGYWSIVVA